MSDGRRDPDGLIRLLSHDVRNVSGALTSFIECLQVVLEGAPSDVQATMNDSLTALSDLSRLHEQLRWIAMWAAGQPIVIPEPGDVRAVLKDVAVLAARLPVVVDLPRDPLPTSGAGVALVRVIDVLIANGVRHGGRPVQVSARAAGKSVVIDIGDSGPAIARTLRDRAFEMREQTEMKRESGARYQPGAGLAIAKLVVEGLGGQLEARGSDGAWSVRILLPHT